MINRDPLLEREAVTKRNAIAGRIVGGARQLSTSLLDYYLKESHKSVSKYIS